MKKQISVAIAIAVLMLSSFAALKLAYAQTPTIALEEPDIVDPPYGSPGYFFDVNITINTDGAGLAGWEAVVYWDPSVMTRFSVTFYSTMGEPLDSYIKGSMGGESIRLGQLKTDGNVWVGAGKVATIQMILLYPGASRIFIFDSTLLGAGLVPITHNRVHSTVKSNRPAPSFYWYATEPDGTTPASALPEHYLKDNCQDIQVYKIIWFDASASYDVSNLIFDGEEWVPGPGYPDIVEYMWDFGDGYTSNDIRLYHGMYPRGVEVRAGDPDVGRPMVHFLPNEKHDETVAVNGAYDGTGMGPGPAWEGVYDDVDASGNVTAGDIRKIPSSMFLGLPASVPVEPVDDDVGLKLVAFDFYEKHTEGWWSEPGVPEFFEGTYVNDKFDDWEHIYKEMQFYKDPDFCSVTAGKALIGHVFQAYNQNGFEVILRVYDSEGDYWQTNWRYGGSKAGNCVKFWRDVRVVSIWPSVDWWDNTEYQPDFGEEMQILVTATNMGTVHERVKVCLYAIYTAEKIDYSGSVLLGTFQWIKEKYFGGWLLKTWYTNIAAGGGTGFGLWTTWTPPKAGFYVFLVTVEIVDAISHDQDPSNNYFFLETVVDNLGTPAEYVQFLCDLDGNGVINNLRDYYIYARNAGQTTYTP